MSTKRASSLKKIAFIAMPFGIKSTGLEPADGPETINYDALWERAIKPALLALDYMPLRADEQSGSVIVKDMLVALVHADLVLADISISNGNVYYEAGIRHAAKESGCILINADWSRPLFDLRQITQIRYPLPSPTPSDSDYQVIRSKLVETIPAYAVSIGPVYELVSHIDNPENAHAELRERTAVLYEFDTALTAARLKAANGEKEELRNMLSNDYLAQLPKFALKELIDAVRDNLNWTILVSVIDSLPETVSRDADFQEQKALALSMGGEMPGAVAIFEEVIKRDGKSCLRLGNLGGLHRRLASIKGARHSSYSHSAIKAFRDGMFFDLNDYYCAHKLLIMLVERNRRGDEAEASRVSTLLEAACQRAVDADSQDEWLYPTLLIHAFYKQEKKQARDYADRVLGQSWSNWKLVGLLTDLLSLLGLKIDADLGEILKNNLSGNNDIPLLEICREIQSYLPISQNILRSKLLPIMDSLEHVYRKQGSVEARLATTGEEIVSVTSSGEETSNHAKEGDIVIRNNTDAKEQYLVSRENFDNRYDASTPLSCDFQSFRAKGQSLALKITHETTTSLGVGATFFITPTWATDQYAEEGDYFVCPLPEKQEIYRVGGQEFEATYVADLP